ncbi:divisome protein SepX/GlpR [Nocardioides limicola]|uniref:divisome protein SepX/GlpR n=1 Tax=Nocardioides limicola TaxID=2803368 RepID=UPI00193C4B2D|nr:hypothetical protein [Nocardioides sp. DJM-14]
MDVSGLIFAALAIAWAAYLLPKAVKHHEEVAKSRSVDRFSHTMRVLSRREPGARLDERVVLTPAREASAPVVTGKRPGPTPAQIRARRAAARVAARRRRRVLLTLLTAVGATAGAAAYWSFSWWYLAIPAGLVVVWLVLCRVMVKGELRDDARLLGSPSSLAESVAPSEAEPVDGPLGTPDRSPVEAPDEYDVVRNPQGFDEPSPMAETAVGGWDPVPTTLPTYVTKDQASRTVRTIDLDATGVWSSARTDEDADLARQAEADRKARRDADERRSRATGA